MRLEGGFQGRTNKLVDACYSFWQGGACAILDVLKKDRGDVVTDVTNVGNVEVECLDDSVEVGSSILAPTSASGQQCYNQFALQRYLLHCSQQIDGGMRDKPSKGRDFYHTCYALSGLSVAQHPTTDSMQQNSEPYLVKYYLL